MPVIGYKTDEFPAFFSAKSGSKVAGYVSNAHDAARVIF